MPYKMLIKMYTERKKKLDTLLSDKKIRLKDERINAIQGAIDEIELFLNVLNQYQEHARVGAQEKHVNGSSLDESLLIRLKTSMARGKT